MFERAKAVEGWLEEPIIDVGCGDSEYGEYVTEHLGMKGFWGLDKYRSPFLPKGIQFIESEFAEWYKASGANRQLWSGFKTVIMSLPVNSPDLIDRPSGAMCDSVLTVLQDHQKLILFSFCPYHSVSVAGTQWMWNWIFENMTLLDQKTVSQRDKAYLLQKGDSTGTRQSILEGHQLWELSTEQELSLIEKQGV